MHDPIYRRLFAFPRMVADLLRAVAQGAWIDHVDLDTLEKLPAEHVGDSGQQRRGDAVWRVRFRNGWLYLLVLLEFQSSNDPRMALRNLEYTALLSRELTGNWTAAGNSVHPDAGRPCCQWCCTTATRHGRQRWRWAT